MPDGRRIYEDAKAFMHLHNRGSSSYHLLNPQHFDQMSNLLPRKRGIAQQNWEQMLKLQRDCMRMRRGM